MTGDNTSIREVPKAPEAQHNQANFHAADLQRGAQPADMHKAGDNNLGKMGFPDTQISGLEAKDRNFNTADAMSKKGGAGTGTGKGLDSQSPAGANSQSPEANAAGHDNPHTMGDSSGHAGSPNHSGVGNDGQYKGITKDNASGQNKGITNDNASGQNKPGDQGGTGGPSGDSDLTRGVKDKNKPGDGAKSQQTPGKPGESDGNPELPHASTIKGTDGASVSSVRDEAHNSYNNVVKDKDGHVSRINSKADGQPGVSTSYDKDGHPTSETTQGNGSRQWDSQGRLTNDTRTDKSNTNKPDDLKTTQNPDGTTSVTAGPGDGSSTKWTYDKNGQLQQQQQDTGSGTRRTEDFHPNGNLQKYDISDYDKTGKTMQDTQTDFAPNGDFRKQQFDDFKGNHSVVEKDEQGAMKHTEEHYPGLGIDKSETWNKDNSYTSTNQHGDMLTTTTIDKDGNATTETKRRGIH